MLKKFEVGVFNTEVREAVQDGAHHRFLDDEWANIHWVEIVGSKSSRKMNRKHNRKPAVDTSNAQAM